jgi:hypothetical protein
MGCASAKPVQATPEQKEEMCRFACKSMCTVCVEQVINVDIVEKKSADFKIEAPGKEVQKAKDFVVTLRKEAAAGRARAEGGGEAKPEEAKAEGEEGPAAEGPAAEAEGPAAEAEAKPKGMMAKARAEAEAMAAKAEGMADKAAGAASAAAGKAEAIVLEGLADSLQARIDALEKDFSVVAQDVVSAKAKEIFDIYIKLITETVFPSATTLVRGADGTKYEAVAPGTIASAFNEASAKKLEEAMLPAVQEETAKHKVVASWDASIEKFNSVNENMPERLSAQLKQEPIQLDIKLYIVQEIIKKLTVLMGKVEDEVRKVPKGRAKRFPRTFERCFSGQALTEDEWKYFESEIFQENQLGFKEAEFKEAPKAAMESE